MKVTMISHWLEGLQEDHDLGSSSCWHHSWSLSAEIPPYDWTVRSFLKEIQAAPLHGCPGPRVCPSAVVLSPNIPHLRERSHTEIQGGRKSLVVAFELPNNCSFLQFFLANFFFGGAMPRGLWDLSSQTKGHPRAPTVEAQRPSWTARDVSQRVF